MTELIGFVVGLAFIGTGIGFWPHGWPAVVVGAGLIILCGYSLARKHERSHGTEGE